MRSYGRAKEATAAPKTLEGLVAQAQGATTRAAIGATEDGPDDGATGDAALAAAPTADGANTGCGTAVVVTAVTAVTAVTVVSAVSVTVVSTVSTAVTVSIADTS